MVFLTKDVENQANELGIGKSEKKKLYKTAREVNSFLKSQQWKSLKDERGNRGDEYEEDKDERSEYQ